MAAINSPYRTSSDLVLSSLKKLRVLAAGQGVDTEDFNYVNEELDSIFRKLAGLEIVYVADPDNIPGVWFPDLADIVAGECATKFGIAGEEYATMVNRGLGGAGPVEIGAGTAAKSLKVIGRGRPTYEPQRIQNF
jgi:hypothetical protein